MISGADNVKNMASQCENCFETSSTASPLILHFCRFILAMRLSFEQFLAHRARSAINHKEDTVTEFQRQHNAKYPVLHSCSHSDFCALEATRQVQSMKKASCLHDASFEVSALPRKRPSVDRVRHQKLDASLHRETFCNFNTNI